MGFFSLTGKNELKKHENLEQKNAALGKILEAKKKFKNKRLKRETFNWKQMIRVENFVRRQKKTKFLCIHKIAFN